LSDINERRLLWRLRILSIAKTVNIVLSAAEVKLDMLARFGATTTLLVMSLPMDFVIRLSLERRKTYESNCMDIYGTR
jgi:hypothetical protein